MSTPNYILFLVIQWVLIMGLALALFVVIYNSTKTTKTVKNILTSVTESNNLIKKYFKERG